jgi:hypothetical protein
VPAEVDEQRNRRDGKHRDVLNIPAVDRLPHKVESIVE